MATAFVLFAQLGDGAYWRFAVTLVVFGFGFGLAITPGTQLIIDGLPADRRTLSAAVNDVTREVGAGLGGVVAGSVLVAVYGAELGTTGLPEPAARAAEDGVAAALGVADRPRGVELVASATQSFTSGYSAACWSARPCCWSARSSRACSHRPGRRPARTASRCRAFREPVRPTR